MAEQINDGYDFSPYPWSVWLNGKTWRMSPHTDFAVKPTTFAAYAKSEGKARSLLVDTKIEDDGCVVIRARSQPALKAI